MQPNVLDGDLVVIEAAQSETVKKGEIVLTDSTEGLRLHRVVGISAGQVITRGDAGSNCDPAGNTLLGRVVAIERAGQTIPARGKIVIAQQRLRTTLRRARLALSARLANLGLAGAVALVLLGAAPAMRAQSADLSMTQGASPTTVAPGGTITYTEVVTNNGPNTATTATFFQAVPSNTTFLSISTPAGWTCATPAVGATGNINCSNASFAAGSSAFTIQVKVAAGAAAGTQITNSADVTSNTADPVATNNATLTTVNVESSTQADLTISGSASPSPVYVASSLTYTYVVQNLGLANITNSATLSDTLPAGVTYVSSTSTQGSCANAAGTVTCSLGALANGASATVSITVSTPATAQSLSNTASVAPSISDPTDPVNSNNSVTIITVVQPSSCSATGTPTAGGNLTGIVNTYFAPSNTTTNLAVGATQVNLGAASGATTPIAVGDRILIIQMQDALFTTTNDSTYGDGITGDPGSGWTSLNSTGKYEFVTATTAVPTTGGTLKFTGTGPSGGTLYAYDGKNYANGANGNGQATYQIIRVPQYTTATLTSGLTALAWNGSVGGVLAFDVSSLLTLGGTVSVDKLGFRGGGGRTLGGNNNAANTDYRSVSTRAAHGSKGEGIAGSPEYTANAAITAVNNSTSEGYPQGSYARGAPGNAGGGGTDDSPSDNSENSGGGGGGNGGTGGLGGYAWNTSGNRGGFGGVAFPASVNQIVMGGGGGAGTTNNGTSDPNTNTSGVNSSGAAGGGIVLITAGSVTGTGSITANGQSAINVQNDGGGGGGAGGSIVLLANSGNLSGLTVSANGGNGGSTWLASDPMGYPGNRHGPGGGGGGGVIILSSTPLSSSVAGGANGQTTTALDAFGSTPGAAGILVTNATAGSVPGPQTGGFCASADLSITNAGSPSAVTPGSNITYTQTVTNNGASSAVDVVVSEAIPANTTFQSISIPSGWTCSTPAVGATGNISCNISLLANAGTGTFTVVVNANAGTIDQTQVTDTVTVDSGTNDPNLTNNSASVTTVVAKPAAADLTVTNVASPNPVATGSNVTFTQVVANNGPSAASTVTFTEAIPTGSTFVSMATPSGWSCSTPAVGGTGNITCTIGTLAVGATATFSPVVKATAAAGSTISDTAYISSALTPDSNPNSNDATASVSVVAATGADLAVTSSATPNPVVAGSSITFSQSITNNGPAASLVDTYSFPIPANTKFASMTTPTGWTCSNPGVGNTGTVTCTRASFASGTVSPFNIVVTVNSGTANGTTITGTSTIASTGTTDPISSNNTVSAAVVVASPSQADVSIVKTGTPDPVDQNTNLVYTLKVSNNGPASALGVTVSDPLPAGVTFVSASSTQGTCNSASPVSCTIGTMSPGSVVIVTINATANTISTATKPTNTATVSTTSSDPNSANNTSSFTSTIIYPTAVQLVSFQAIPQSDGTVLLEWKTREEIRNLGFNVYRESGSGRQKLNPSLIAGSALILKRSKPQHGAKTYQWIDANPSADASYVLEDVDLDGSRNTHGPVKAEASATRAAARSGAAPAALITHLNALASESAAATASPAVSSPASPRRIVRESLAPAALAVPAIAPVNLDGEAAVKISVDHQGWYRVTRSQLVAAGFDASSNAHTLQLFAEGVEQPLLINGNQVGSLDPKDSIEFYGTGIDTPYSGTRVYWLVSGHQAGKRIPLERPYSGSSPVNAFVDTSVRQDRTTYFAALLNSEDQDNFFGAVITNEPVDQILDAAHVVPSSNLPVSLDVTLQGASDGQAHSVSVSFNGNFLGTMQFAGETSFHTSFPLNPATILEGANTVTLTALNGDDDVSLVQSIVLHYARSFAADGNFLQMQATAGSAIQVSGFSNSRIRVFDISNPEAIQQLQGTVRADGSSFTVDFGVPGSANSSQQRDLLALADDQVEAPVALAFHPRSTLASQPTGASIVMISHPDFVQSLAPLVQLREQQGYTVKVVTTEQIFDAFNYGERSPYAIRSYLRSASSRLQGKPQFLLLVGDASVDPRNYLGFGNLDFVPTRLIDTQSLKTASDDWFSDFKQTGYATIPTGRLPVRTAADASMIVAKIVAYETGRSSGTWNSEALVIADQNVGSDFSSTADAVAASLKSVLSVNKIETGDTDPGVVKQQIVDAINQGKAVVNFTGHGSVEQWSFSDLFDDNDAAALQNGGRLPVFFIMNCLNGFFQDVYTQSLAESLVLNPNGGAVAVWASSGFTDAPPQAGQDIALAKLLASRSQLTLGQIVLQTKTTTVDPDVRRTWILFGDPAMRMQFTAPAPAAISRPAPAKPNVEPRNIANRSTQGAKPL